MKLPISDRLLACAAFIAPGDRVADIGCDHGYLAIHALTTGLASSVIAADIGEGPLQSALHNSVKYGVRDKIEFYLSDGVRNIPRDFNSLVCAGMGGDTMIHILESAHWLRNERYRMILQCQSKTPMLRKYLSETGWRITEESVLKDGRFLYTIMEVRWEPDYPMLTEAECYFPPALLVNPSPDLKAYFQWVVRGLEIATEHQDDEEKKRILAVLHGHPDFAFLRE